MKEFELKTLVYNDGDKFRSFQSSDFTFILDKKSKISICYGSTMEETPTYDPLSPEIIDLYIDKDFKFENEVQNINKLFNINVEKDKELITISTISTVNFIINDIYDEIISEVTKLYKYLNKFSIFINLVIPYNDKIELRDVLRLKLFDIQNVNINVKKFNAKVLLDQTNLILSKNIDVSYNFYITKENYEEFISLIENKFPGNTFSNIYFKEKLSKVIKNKIVKAIKDKGNFTIYDTKDDLNYDLVLPYQDGLFRCYISFKNKMISYSPDFKESISFNDVDRINSYWLSDIFNNYRMSLIKDKYEKIKKEIKEDK